MINKIKINEQIWIFFSKNKWIIGSLNLPSDIHLTFHFGGNSGVIDLHFKNEKTKEYFTILTILKIEIEDIISILLRNLLNILKNKIKILSFKDFKKEYQILDYKILEDKFDNIDINFFLTHFQIKKRKKTLTITPPIGNMKVPYNFQRLIKNHITQNRRRANLSELTGGNAIRKTGENFSYFVIEKQIYLLDSNIIENIDELFVKTIGTDLSKQVMDRFQEGIEYLAFGKRNNKTNSPINIRIIQKNENEGSA
ncbi:hypothetical protein [Leptospira jelokensis]|uniref:hypothetical protein n=1 Tax=Leptospira jelokensis TaxID=2484931 RepID=UPI001091400D|nr:hypothetical protein [Leptospira jelokensis]TGM03230.1 hypothetical protein EHQ79_06605 [Leptospira jelokensis]